MNVSLPKNPTASQYEDLVTAWVSALGYSVTTRSRFVGNSAVLSEFELLATASGEAFPQRVLVAPRAEAWGFGDLFRMAGWQKFLGLGGALVVHAQPPAEQQVAILGAIAEEQGVRCPEMAVDGTNLGLSLGALAGTDPGLALALARVGWWGRIGQRQASAQFMFYCRQHQDIELCQAAERYYAALETSFSRPDPIDRLAVLYSAYRQNPNLTARLVEVMATRGKTSQTEIWDRLKDTGEALWLQYVALLETKVRIAMIASGLEYLLGEARPDAKIAYGTRSISGREFWEHVFPEQMRLTLEDISQDRAAAARVPYALESFIEVFGGFYAERPEELDLMAKAWGVGQEDVPRILELYDRLFSTGSGKAASWFFREEGGLTFLKSVPGFVRGAGCLLRFVAYGLTDYAERFPGGDLRLARWHTSLARAIEPELRGPGGAEETAAEPEAPTA